MREHNALSGQAERLTVRGEASRVFLLTEAGVHMTKLEYYCRVDFGGHSSVWMTANAASTMLMNLPYRAQQYFQQLQPCKEYTMHDGRRLGHMLMDLALSKKGRRLEVAMATFVVQTAALRDAPMPYAEVFLKAATE
jgi:hypothetical protein